MSAMTAAVTGSAGFMFQVRGPRAGETRASYNREDLIRESDAQTNEGSVGESDAQLAELCGIACVLF